jgi:hypothetical protein
MTPEQLLNEKKREFARLDLQVKELKAAGRSEEAKAQQERLRQLGRAIVAGNQGQDEAERAKHRKPVEYGAPSFKKPASEKNKPEDKK